MTSDDELFEELRRRIVPPPIEPPAESVAALHAAVATKFAPKTRRSWWRRKLAVGTAVFGLVAGAPAAAFAISGAPLPDPLRTAMHAIGIPVDSVPVANTKTAEADLQHALTAGNASALTTGMARLQECLSDLNGADRARLSRHADSLLQSAASEIREHEGGVPEASGNEGSGSSTSDKESPTGGRGSSSGSSTSVGSNDSSGGSGRSGGSGEGDQATTVPVASTTPTRSGDGSTSGGGDGGQTTTTTTPSGGTSGEDVTTTTVRTSGGGDGGGSSDSGSGSDGGSTPTTTRSNASH